MTIVHAWIDPQMMHVADLSSSSLHAVARLQSKTDRRWIANQFEIQVLLHWILMEMSPFLDWETGTRLRIERWCWLRPNNAWFVQVNCVGDTKAKFGVNSFARWHSPRTRNEASFDAFPRNFVYGDHPQTRHTICSKQLHSDNTVWGEKRYDYRH